MALADMLNGLSDIINGKRTENTPPAPVKVPDQMIGAPGVFQAPVLGNTWALEAAAQLPRFVENIAALPTTVYSLADSLGKWLSGSDEQVLPGADAARTKDEQIRAPFQNVEEFIIDKPRNTSLIEGSPPELMANWGGLVGTAVAQGPAVVTRMLDDSIRALEAGKGIISRTGEYALKGLEVASPVMMRTPTRTVEAASIATPGALGVGLELAFPDPDKAKLDEQAKAATDASVQQAESVGQVQQAVEPIRAGLTTGNDWLDASILGVAGVASIAAMKRDVLGRVLDSMGKKVDQGMVPLRTEVIDRTVPIKDMYAQLAGDETIAKRFADRIDSSHGAAINTKLQSVFDYGEIPHSAVKLPSVKDFYMRMQQLTPQQRDVFKSAPRATINADAQLSGLAREYDSIVGKMLDYAVEGKYLSPAERIAINSRYASDYPIKFANGETHLAPRVGKHEFMEGRTWDELPSFVEDVVRRVEWNRQAAILMHVLRQSKASGNPIATKVLGRTDVTTQSNPNVFAYRDKNGIARVDEVLNPALLSALRNGSNMSQLHALSGSMGWFARRFEEAATGRIATVLGQPFAHIAALYNAGIGSALRERGTNVGYIDKALQSVTKGMRFEFGLPGDPTILADMTLRAAQGVAAVTAKRVGNFLHESVVREGVASNVLTPQTADRIAKALTNHYKRSWVHTFQQEGLLGPASVGGVNPEQTIKTLQTRLATANVPVRAVRETEKFVRSVIDNVVNFPFSGWLGDVAHTVSASPGASVRALNKHLPRELQNRAVRELTGDPSRSGAFSGGVGRAAGKLTAATPWGNIYLQSTDKFVRALRNNPGGAIAGLTTAIGVPTISAALWNARLGPEYSDYQYNRRSPDRQTSSIYVGLPGVAPERGLEIPVDPLSRPYKWGVELLAGANLGLLDGSLFNPENATMRDAFTEMVGPRWQGFGEGSIGKSVIEGTVIPPVPTAPAAALAGIGGVDWRSYLDVKPIHERTDAGYTGSNARDPFRDVIGIEESAKAETVMRKLGANAGAMAYNMFMDSAKRADEGQGIGEIAKNAKDTILLGTSDAGRQVSGLLGGFASVSPSQEAAGKLVHQKVKGLQQLDKALQAVTSQGALDSGEVVGNRKIGYQALLGGKLAVEPNDPKMLVLSQFAQHQLRQVEMFLQQNKADFQQRASVQAATDLSPERKRARNNMISEGIVERNRQLLTVLQQFESQASKALGVPIKLDELNVGEGMEQFQ